MDKFSTFMYNRSMLSKADLLKASPLSPQEATSDKGLKPKAKAVSASGYSRKKADKLWEFLKKGLEKKMEASHYKAWVQNSTTLLEIKDQLVVVATNTGYTKRWLDTNARKVFQEVIQDIFGFNEPEVDFKVESKLFKRKIIEKEDTSPILEPENSYQIQLDQAIETAYLNKRYSLDNFVVGAGNQLAHAAAVAVSNSLGDVYNPLFVYGNVGIGKTHLLQAIGHEVLKKDPKKKVLYCPSETFLNEVVAAIQNRKTEELREKYRKVDLLLIDDVQFIARGKRTQDELFHTFNVLHQTGKQIAFASDRPPSEISGIADRLRSRFEGGMVADILPPDYETRMAILNKKVEETKSSLDQEILEMIAEMMESNIRELEGAFNQINSLTLYSDTPITKAVIVKALGKNLVGRQKRMTPQKLIKTVAAEFNVTVKNLKSSGRTQFIALPRQIAMYLIRKELQLPYEQIAEFLNRKDHTTVMHAVKKVESLLAMDRELQLRVSRIKREME